MSIDIQSIIQHNKRLRETILENDIELKNIQYQFWNELKLQNLIKQPIIATGHQPILYYPGILFKNYYAGVLAGETGGSALNFIVDSDTGEIDIPIPCRNDSKLCKNRVVIKNDRDTVFSGFHPSGEEVNQFLTQTENHLSTLGDNYHQIQKAFQNYKKAFSQIFEKTNHFIDTENTLRTEFESDLGIHFYDLKISDISKTIAYNCFILYIIKHIETFRFHFNEAIIQNKTKDYQPVKELGQTDEWYELPFWWINNDRRYPVFVHETNEMLHFSSPDIKDKINISISGKTEEQIAGKLNTAITLYPKATTLTFMTRILFSDLFIHGTGAVEYEKVNNLFFNSFFGLNSPLQFMSATGNIYLPLKNNMPDLSEIEEDYRRLQKWLKEYKRNPEDLLSPELADKYKEKKRKIASQMKDTDPDKRKDLHKQLEQLNEKMKEHLSENRNKTERLLAQYEQILQNKSVYFERHYPYFIYPKETLSAENFEANLKTRLH